MEFHGNGYEWNLTDINSYSWNLMDCKLSLMVINGIYWM